MESLAFDTTFLIDFQQERKRREPGRAHEFLKHQADKGAFLSAVVYGEYAEGFNNLYDPAFLSVVESFELLPITRATAARYSMIARHLRQAGLLIGANDLWIAAVALEHNLPLVTDNISHFERVPDLQLVGY